VVDTTVPALTIVVDPEAAPYKLSLEGPAVANWSDEERLLGRLPNNWNVLAEQAQGSLKEFLAKTDRALGLDWPTSGAAIDLILTDGGLIWDQIIGPLAEFKLDRLQQSLAPFLSSSDVSDVLASARAAPLIEVKCPHDAILPIEILPLGIRGGYSAPRDEAEVLAAARLLPAFSCMVRYVIYGQPSEDRVATQSTSVDSGLLPQGRALNDPSVTYLRSTGAPAWQDMREYFESVDNRVILLGVYPEVDQLGNADDLALFMIAPEMIESFVTLAQEPEGRPLSSIYVHAHGRQAIAVGDAFYFEFKFPKGGRSPLRVANRDLKKGRQRVIATGRKYAGARLFLNSCFSSGTLGKELLGCSMLLLYAGAQTLVAPREETPAGVARELAKAYYDFASQDANSGQALLAARLQLLGQYRNPMGALYTILGQVE
jgi:hypothetical protein